MLKIQPESQMDAFFWYTRSDETANLQALHFSAITLATAVGSCNSRGQLTPVHCWRLAVPPPIKLRGDLALAPHCFTTLEGCLIVAKTASKR